MRAAVVVLRLGKFFYPNFFPLLTPGAEEVRVKFSVSSCCMDIQRFGSGARAGEGLALQCSTPVSIRSQLGAWLEKSAGIAGIPVTAWMCSIG